MVQFTVEEENLICMYHKSRPAQDGSQSSGLPCRTWTRTWRRWPARPPTSWTPCSDADFEAQRFHFTDE